jgi:hypothetical protein
MYQLFRSGYILCCHLNLSRFNHLDNAITDPLEVEAALEKESPRHVHVLRWGIRYHL